MVKSFREYYEKRIAEDMNQQSGVNADTPSQVTAPTDPKEIQRRKAVSDIASTLMKKNPRLKPGGTDASTVSNLSSADPSIQKADPQTQQAVSAYFLKAGNGTT
jgi:hypothetical protein